MKPIYLENINKIGIEATFGNYLYTNAVICLLSQSHSTGVNIKVKTGYEDSELTNFSVLWDQTLNENELKSYNDEKRTTDFGAMCVAILLSINLTEYTNIETTQQGGGFDFLLTTENNDTLNFLGSSARLEVSGIRKETKNNTSESRLKKKKNQTAQSDDTGTPAYICIVEFSQPKSIFLKK